MAYAKRKIDLEFRLGKGSFGGSGFNTVKATGLRVTAAIEKAGAIGMHTLNARVYGLDQSIANSISTLGKVLTAGRNNLVSVSAGDDQSGMSVVFLGTIDTAWSDYTGAPDAAVVIRAHTGLFDALRPLPAVSFQGSADVATIMSGIAQQMGYTFENSGVSVQLSNPYFPGTGRDQAYAAARAADINIAMDDQPGGTLTLAIWPKDGARGGVAPLVSPDTGMVNYPTWVENGVIVKTLYNPSLMAGGKVNIKSAIPNANGTWQIFNLRHDLESEIPEGEWFTTASCNVLGHQQLAT